MTARLSDAACLRARELGARMHPIDRALLLLALTDDSGINLADLSLAERNLRLIALHSAKYGEKLTLLCDCPTCGDTQEIDVSLQDLETEIARSAPPDRETITFEGAKIQIRALTSCDLAKVALEQDVGHAADMLQKLASSAAPDCEKLQWGENGQLAAAVLARIEAREEASSVRFGFCCSKCEHEWSELFDPGETLFSKVNAEAGQLIQQIVALAERFGWSEAEILAVPAERRAAYLAAGRG